jgi:hypothetical protein
MSTEKNLEALITTLESEVVETTKEVRLENGTNPQPLHSSGFIKTDAIMGPITISLMEVRCLDEGVARHQSKLINLIEVSLGVLKIENNLSDLVKSEHGRDLLHALGEEKGKILFLPKTVEDFSHLKIRNLLEKVSEKVLIKIVRPKDQKEIFWPRLQKIDTGLGQDEIFQIEYSKLFTMTLQDIFLLTILLKEIIDTGDTDFIKETIKSDRFVITCNDYDYFDEKPVWIITIKNRKVFVEFRLDGTQKDKKDSVINN